MSKFFRSREVQLCRLAIQRHEMFRQLALEAGDADAAEMASIARDRRQLQLERLQRREEVLASDETGGAQ